MSDTNNYRLETLSLHAGQSVNPATQSRGVAVERTTSYLFKSAEHAENLFGLKELGNIYTRIGNPTQDILEQRITALEGGAASVAFASGTSAIHNTIITIAKQGDEIVAANNLYGGTHTMFNAILPQFGIATKFVDPKDPKNFKQAITSKTKLIFVETIGNPGLDFTDIAAVAKIAHAHGLPLVVDATFTTPYLLRAIEHGADIVINSLTKWIGGHGSAIGGIVTDAGTFDWTDSKFELFNQPDPNYHGLRWAHDLPAPLAPVAFALRLRTVPLRNLGAAISPDNAWIFIQGAETLPLRMVKHSENALRVAEFLSKDKRVSWVRYPGLKQDPSHSLASNYLAGGYGGVVVFGVKGGHDSAVKLIDNIQLFSHLANVGDTKSLILHPASTSQSQLSKDEQGKSGMQPELLRLSVGLEHVDDIIEALDAALDISQK